MREDPGIRTTSSDQAWPDSCTLPEELLLVRDTVVPGLMNLLRGTLDATDDTLFELANDARSNSDYNRCFETMRELRLKRKSIENQFLQALGHLFLVPPCSNAGETAKPRRSLEADSPCSANHNTLEEQVTLNAMITRAAVSEQPLLLQLQTRFSALYPDSGTAHPVNPLAPEHLCRAFQQACSELAIQVRERLLLLRHFDRYVLTSLGIVLDEANRLLHPYFRCPSAGLPHPPSAQPETEGVDAARQTDTQAGADIDSDPLNMESLLSGYRRYSSDVMDHTSRESVHILSHQELDALLATILSRWAGIDLLYSAPDPPGLRSMVGELLARRCETLGKRATLTPKDEDLVNLVSLLFESILNDRNLPDPLRALLSRLQVPILKAALRDPAFFSAPSHPARKLLDTLGHAGIGWSSHEEVKWDRLYSGIHKTVARLLAQSDSEPALFEALYGEFEALLEDENRKAALVEQRTREAERGRIKTRKAQEAVEQTLAQRLAGHEIPEGIQQLLVQGWSRVMWLAYLRDDTEYPWEHALGTVDDLLWCLHPGPPSDERKPWVRQAPALVRTIQSGLEAVACPPHQLETGMANLRHQLALAFQKQATRATSEAGAMPLEESPRQTASAPGPACNDAIIAQHYETLETLNVGDWVAFYLVNGAHFRCKLSAVIEDADCFVFVNRMGLKVVTKSRDELAHALLCGELVPLEEVAIVEHALSGIVRRLSRKAS
ncbi:DUF1631 domain-containing protein [Halomonadaceae bacterium KBTZ08]